MKMKNRKGSTLVMTLMVFAVLMILGTVILNLMVTENKMSINHRDKTQAYYIARSGVVAVEAAIMDMNDAEIKELIILLDDEKNNGVIEMKEIEIGKDKVDVKLIKKDDSIEIASQVSVGKTKETVTKVLELKLVKP